MKKIPQETKDKVSEWSEAMYKAGQLKLEFYCDHKRHLVCHPYSIENLHIMATVLCIKRCWFHKNHYDIPKRRIAEIQAKCRVVSPKDIALIINEEKITEALKKGDELIKRIQDGQKRKGNYR